MGCFALSLALVSAFMPPPGSGDQAAAPAPVVAQAPAPQPTYAPPPQPMYAPPPQPTYMPPPAPVVYAPPPAMGLAPALKGPSVWGILPYSYGAAGIGAGGRFMIPLGIAPLLRNTSVRDNFSLEVGADYLRWSFSYVTDTSYALNEFLPVAGIMWNIWLNDNFILYPKFELGYQFIWLSGFPSGYPTPSYGGVYWDIGGGVIYKLAGGISLRAEIGYAGLKGGVGWLF
jgi:hypothetical protein